MKTRVLSAYNELSKLNLGSGIAVVDSITEPIKVLKILMEGLAPTKGAGYWIIRFRGLPIARSFSPFDLLYLDDEFRVLHTVEITQSSDFVPFKGIPSSALVLPAGSILTSKTFNGDSISLRPDSSAPAAPELPAQLASLAARGMQVTAARPPSKPQINITAAPTAKPLAHPPAEPGTVLRPAKKHDAAEPNAKPPAAAPPVRPQPAAAPPDQAVLRPSRQAPATQRAPAPQDITPAASIAAQPAIEPTKDATPAPAAVAPAPATAPSPPQGPEKAPARQQPPGIPAAAPVVPQAPVPASAQAAPAPSTLASAQAPAAVSLAPQTTPSAPAPAQSVPPAAAPTPRETKPDSKQEAPASHVHPAPLSAAPSTQSATTPQSAATPTAAPVPAVPQPPAVAASQATPPPSTLLPSAEPAPPQPSTPAEPAADSAEKEPDAPTVVMHGAKLSQEELFKLLGADKAFDLVELAPEWPAPAPQPRQKKKQSAPAPKTEPGEPDDTELPEPIDDKEFRNFDEEDEDTQLEIATKKNKLQKNEAKLARRWDVKLLYSLFPELHPEYRPEFQLPYIDFVKYINNPEEREKLTMKVQVLSWLYPELELETVEKRQREHRRAPRVADPGLIGYYFSSGYSEPHPIRNFSVWGFYMITEEKWLPGTIIRVTLQVAGSDGTNPGDALTVHARVVNWDKTGAGFEFVLPGFLDED